MPVDRDENEVTLAILAANKRSHMNGVIMNINLYSEGKALVFVYIYMNLCI